MHLGVLKNLQCKALGRSELPHSIPFDPALARIKFLLQRKTARFQYGYVLPQFSRVFFLVSLHKKHRGIISNSEHSLNPPIYPSRQNSQNPPTSQNPDQHP